MCHVLTSLCNLCELCRQLYEFFNKYEGSLQSFLPSLVAAGKTAQSFFLCRKGTLFMECMLMNGKWHLMVFTFPKDQGVSKRNRKNPASGRKVCRDPS